MIHHLKIYPEHFSAVCTGIKRAELRKNDRDFKVGDTLHLMETPKGSCSPTGEYINAVVTHIADVGEWLPGYVMLSIERESGYAAPQLPQPAVMDEQYQHLSELYHAQEKRLFKIAQRIKGPSFDKYAYSPSQAIDVLESEIFGEREGDGRAAMLQGAEPVQEATTDNTSQQFESLGLIATSDERKMEAPRCGKHPETELQVHPFEQLLSYPPQPAMYCPLCRPSVAEWVEFDKQLRQWKEVK